MTAAQSRWKSILPAQIRVRCRANGEPLAGALVSLVVAMTYKNDFSMTSGPTDDTGLVIITADEILYWIDWDARHFQMDYSGSAHFSGELLVKAEGRAGIAGCLAGYDLYRSYLPFPEGYPERLQAAKTVIEGIVPAKLTVEVEHDGPPNLIIRTQVVQA